MKYTVVNVLLILVLQVAESEEVSVWILGDSMVWEAKQSLQQPQGPQMGLEEMGIIMTWKGHRGTYLIHIVNQLPLSVASASSPPDVIVLHAGTNDMGHVPYKQIRDTLKYKLSHFQCKFPQIYLIWSDVILCKEYQVAMSTVRLDSTRKKL